VSCRYQVRENSGTALSISCCVPKREGLTLCCSGSVAVAETKLHSCTAYRGLRFASKAPLITPTGAPGEAGTIYHGCGSVNSPAERHARSGLTATHSLIYISQLRSLFLCLKSCGLQQLRTFSSLTAPNLGTISCIFQPRSTCFRFNLVCCSSYLFK
jgi:hypothetical protein